MLLRFQILFCLAAFGMTIMVATDHRKIGFHSAEDFVRFKEERRLMRCDMSPQVTEDKNWIRDVPTCSFGGYYPSGPTVGL